MSSTHGTPLLSSLVPFTRRHVGCEVLCSEPGCQCRTTEREGCFASAVVELLLPPACERPSALRARLGPNVAAKVNVGFLPSIALSSATQDTLEDIDKNSDGHVDADEYIGKWGEAPKPFVLLQPATRWWQPASRAGRHRG